MEEVRDAFDHNVQEDQEQSLIQGGPRETLEEEPVSEQGYFPKSVMRLSKQEALRQYEINIRFLDQGCIVKVGCKEFAFDNIFKAMNIVHNYVTGDTFAIQEEWLKKLK